MIRDAELAGVLQELREGLERELGDQLEDVLLFGSRARGEARAGSDVDVLVLLKSQFD